MIELLSVQKNWAKVKAGFKGVTFFKSPVSKGSMSFTSGYKPEGMAAIKQSMGSVSGSAFTGKTFSSRK